VIKNLGQGSDEIKVLGVTTKYSCTNATTSTNNTVFTWW